MSYLCKPHTEQYILIYYAMLSLSKQIEKAEAFKKLHDTGKLLILPNVWDSLSALLLQDLGYPAVATASASMAFTNGLKDGENISFEKLLTQLKEIANSVSLPVSADIESGYADNNHQLSENINALLDAGIIGINIEDTDKKIGGLLTIEQECERIKLLRTTATAKGIPLFINARVDTYIRMHNSSEEEKLEETIRRGNAYKEAGADCIFPITMKKYEEIKTLVSELKMPVNIITIPGIPPLDALEEIGVARVSLGASFLKIAMQAMKNLAVQLKDKRGLNDITTNTITSDYLESLIEMKLKS